MIHYYYWLIAIDEDFKQKMACAFHKNFMGKYDSLVDITKDNIISKAELYSKIRESAYDKLSHKVYCYETKQTYNSVKEADRIFGKECVSGICKHKSKYLLGEDYILYHFDFIENIDLTKTFEQPKRVYCYNNKTFYKNHFEAKDKLNLDSALIKRCCDHKTKSYNGYYFDYEENVNSEFIIPNTVNRENRKIFCKELNKTFIGYIEVMNYFNISDIKIRDALYGIQKINKLYTLEYAEDYGLKHIDTKNKREKINWNQSCFNPYTNKKVTYKQMNFYLYDHKELVPTNMCISEFTKTFIITEDNKCKTIFDL